MILLKQFFFSLHHFPLKLKEWILEQKIFGNYYEKQIFLCQQKFRVQFLHNTCFIQAQFQIKYYQNLLDLLKLSKVKEILLPLKLI
ncbi:unnamed protein product [Paramecium sonneborni]|uniref:Uncharacterized protein n=1 Tax=Paramecium sonneborni TaxID=65129 RepID=A0A8S1NX62_9CILI|nr:unnamed protein product [Paramecium sonneborni]